MARLFLRILVACFLAGNAQAEDSMRLTALRQAAENGVAQAQTDLGSHYLIGQGTTRNPVAAHGWYLKAAEQNHPLAQTILGWLYMGGAGIDADYTKAALWLRRAALHGIPEAQLSLGTLYARGEGVPQNFIDSYMWLSVAAQKLPAGQKRDEAYGWQHSVSKFMTRDQIDQLMPDEVAEITTAAIQAISSTHIRR